MQCYDSIFAPKKDPKNFTIFWFKGIIRLCKIHQCALRIRFFVFTQIFLIFIIGIIMEQMFTFIKSMCLWKNCKKVDAGTLKIVKTANGFSFTNPGTLKLPKEEIYRGGNSKPRNPRMQTMLRMVGFGDNAGSGFPTILDVWEKAGWRQPELLEDTVLDQVTLELNIVSKMKEDENFVQKNERSFERSFRRKRL